MLAVASGGVITSGVGLFYNYRTLLQTDCKCSPVLKNTVQSEWILLTTQRSLASRRWQFTTIISIAG